MATRSRRLDEAPCSGFVDVDFFRWGTDERLIADVPGRWSSHPEPIRSVPATGPVAAAPYGGGTASAAGPPQGFIAVYDPTLSPREHDVAATHVGEEVPVAVLTTNGAFAWTTASYAHPGWALPGHQLSNGTYRVRVRVRGSSVVAERSFRLEYLDDDFTRSRLHET